MRTQPILVVLADEFDEVYSQAVHLIRPVRHLLDEQALTTFEQDARSHLRRIEGAATAASIARSLLETGLPSTRNDRAYRRLVQAVRE